MMRHHTEWDFNSPRRYLALRIGDEVEFYCDEDGERIAQVCEITGIRVGEHTPGSVIVDCDPLGDVTVTKAP